MPKIDIQELDKELREGKIRPLYILVGAERYLAHTSLRRIQDVIGAGDTVSSYTGKEAKSDDVITALRTVPLLGGRPLVIIRDAENISKNMVEALATYLESPVSSSTLVLVAEKLDGRTKFMQLANKVGTVIECKPLYMDKVPFWINIEVKRQGRQISMDAAKFLAEMVGSDLGQLASSIERVILYIGERKIIDVKDIEEAVTETHQHDIFELTDAVGGKKLSKAISLLHNLIANNESPVLLVNMLARHFRILSRAKEVVNRVSDPTEVAKYLGVHPYFVKNYLTQAKNFSSGELRNNFRALYTCDRALKSSRLDNVRILEKTLLAIIK